VNDVVELPGVAHLHIPRDILAEAYRALYRSGIPFVVSERAYRRWFVGAPAEMCKYGVKDARHAVDCMCRGCVEKLCFFYLDQVRRDFGVPS
jgi:hypothetical protein